jgi:hypothetical protein
MRRSLAIALPALAALVLGAWLLLPGDPPSAPAAAPTLAAGAPPTIEPALPGDQRSTSAAASPTPLQLLPPRSLIGSDPDGAVGLDADGRLRIDAALRHWFDWHRAAIGELDEPAIGRRREVGLQE